MDTASAIVTPNQLHQHLFNPLGWLDRLDDEYLSRPPCCPAADRNNPVHHTLLQLLHALDPLEQDLAWHPLLDSQRHAALLTALQSRQRRIAALITQLRPPLRQLLHRGCDSPPLVDQPMPPEAHWDAISVLAPALQEQLIRYLALLEQAFRLQPNRNSSAQLAAVVPSLCRRLAAQH